MKEYYKDPRINASTLKLFAMRDYDPEIARYKAEKGVTPTAAMALGSAVHSIMEHKGTIGDEFTRSPYDSFRTKEAKEWKAKQEAVGTTILTDADWDQAHAMANAMFEKTASPVREMLKTGDSEVAYYTQTEKCLCDLVHGDSIVDFKTTRASSLQEFEREAIKFGYDVQVAHYLNVTNLSDFYFVAVSSVEPHPVWTIKASSDLIIMGLKRIAIAKERMAESVTSPAVYELCAPSWFGEVEGF